jgi:hypothetical protein
LRLDGAVFAWENRLPLINVSGSAALTFIKTTTRFDYDVTAGVRWRSQ